MNMEEIQINTENLHQALSYAVKTFRIKLNGQVYPNELASEIYRQLYSRYTLPAGFDLIVSNVEKIKDIISPHLSKHCNTEGKIYCRSSYSCSKHINPDANGEPYDMILEEIAQWLLHKSIQSGPSEGLKSFLQCLENNSRKWQTISILAVKIEKSYKIDDGIILKPLTDMPRSTLDRLVAKSPMFADEYLKPSDIFPKSPEILPSLSYVAEYHDDFPLFSNAPPCYIFDGINFVAWKFSLSVATSCCIKMPAALTWRIPDESLLICPFQKFTAYTNPAVSGNSDCPASFVAKSFRASTNLSHDQIDNSIDFYRHANDKNYNSKIWFSAYLFARSRHSSSLLNLQIAERMLNLSMILECIYQNKKRNLPFSKIRHLAACHLFPDDENRRIEADSIFKEMYFYRSEYAHGKYDQSRAMNKEGYDVCNKAEKLISQILLKFAQSDITDE